MEIIGRGFLAKNLQPLAERHPGVTVMAAGVSSASGTAEADFRRERALLTDLIDGCRRRGRKLVFFSTASAGMYGSANGDGREDGPVRPQTPYGRHKLSLERLLADASVDQLVLRISHLIGPNQRAHQLIPALILQVRSGRVRIHRGGTRDLIDIADMVRLVDGLLDIGLSHEVVNVASGTQYPVEGLIDRVERAMAAGRAMAAERVYVDVPSQASPVCIDKLHKLLPDVVHRMFPVDYPDRVLDKYLDVLAHAYIDNDGGHRYGY